MLEIVKFVLGPVQTNSYLVADPNTRDAAVIDPAWDGQVILEAAQKRGWRIRHLWYTHAHFDHIGGAAAMADALDPLPVVALHPNDRALWSAGGGGALFGFDINPGPEPTIDFYQGQILRLGDVEIEVRFTPGHTPGHCIFYVRAERSRSAMNLSFDYAQDEGVRAERSVALSLSKDRSVERITAPVSFDYAQDEGIRAERSRSVELGRSICFTGDLIFAGSVGRTDLPGGDWDTLINSIKTQVFTLPDETRLLPGHGSETTVGYEKENNPFVGEDGCSKVRKMG
jgi:hydroxyacylglutathione hydrolase